MGLRLVKDVEIALEGTETVSETNFVFEAEPIKTASALANDSQVSSPPQMQAKIGFNPRIKKKKRNK